MIFSIADVVADQQHAIDRVLVVEAVVHFRDPVVAGVGVGEAAGVAGRGRRGVLDEAARAGDVAPEGLQPNMFRLTGLIAAAPSTAFTPLRASTMLFAQSPITPAGQFTLDGAG